MLHTVYLGLGSNLGDRASLLQQAEDLLRRNVGPITARSKQYETAPEGFESTNNFLNMVVRIETVLNPQFLRRATEDIERRLGRSQKSRNGVYHDRTIDIDILYYDQRVYRYCGLVLPHPRLHERQFVLKPLCDIAPDELHPGLGKTNRQLLRALNRKANQKKL
ncbi:MAG: 2-amino-4-hydroxy-6-hydroxymethyldihydropteridine diphosphokinase [Paludibacteraceae bacterium]|nr:2-amino-4-hydroxy-6-hydroxymethyldihydropteridine diphosphokinase [Paludibacteraceae bacterium]